MKKLMALLLVVAMVFVFAACQPATSPVGEATESPATEPAESPADESEEPTETAESTGDKAGDKLDTLTVGTPDMNGDFIEGFGNSAYDAAIKNLLHNYTGLVVVDPAGKYVVNESAVKEYTAELDENGNKVYTWTLNEGLLWSDGSPLTAQDYVFAMLYQASPQWVEAGASGSVGYGLLGYQAYNAGETDVFAGVKLVDDYTLQFIIDAAELPYFYELSYVTVAPAPMAVYAPGATIETTEEGSKIVCDDLLAALNNVAATERFAPTVVSGPYKFVSFENQTVTLELNENFMGDYQGNKPTIQYIVQKSIPQDTNHDAVIAGDVDIVAGTIEGYKIEAAKAADTVVTHSYLRNGFGYLAMHCDWGPTADVNVRWALAYLVDRNAVVDYVLGGYGGTVQAEYGLAQWMYEEAGADLEEMLTPFNLNVDKANELLDQTEWKYEADGTTPFDASKATADGSYLRYNAEGEPLQIHHMGAEENDVTDIIEIQYVANAPLAGIAFDVTRADFNALLDNFYYGYELGEDRYYNTFNLATEFSAAFDPYMTWHSSRCGTWENSCQLADEQLDEIMMKMRALDPEQTDEFVDLWLQYETRWQELMPQIPLYSNEYYDFAYYTVDGIENTTPFAKWEDVICYISKSAK